MNGKKCRFAVREVKYLGHILSGKGISVDPAKTDVITNWPKPKTPKQVKSFLGVQITTEDLLRAILSVQLLCGS